MSAEESHLSRETIGGKARTFRFSVIIEKDEDGYFAYVPELQGCYTQGDTYEEVLKNIRDAIRLHVEDRLESGEEIPQPESVSLTSLEIAIWPRSSQGSALRMLLEPWKTQSRSKQNTKIFKFQCA